ncbi:Predicted PurR-regulated permease PerM [Methanosarcina thermophila]|jgi:predicted PurR-regulated permease PerM|uniref:Membrane protein, putative n=4 Tax=Methanosarcina thermophila TaxID=2210 RepID=A0A0E3H9R1_METTE|nr:AI-2E family transporter [Methanosarcina thermophila]ALK06137.1 MAG: permease [Methanosarcina sp. 795]AKB12253.1 membrane protein, putative [Methanosarcina thermophila TM-1]AKB14544.1 membrane protein, putative [Methanosarcina thermophila CHTI-55]NLU56439.1 AI-2E family transporter [Methanosarcina thermophila]SFT67873.1 Predicted PurR-regulated permease PerM [Methanosarcina thermophila]
MKNNLKMALALLIIIVLTVIIIYATLPYLNYIFGAFILFTIFRPLYQFLVKKVKIRKQIAAVLVIIVSIFVVLIPFYFLLSMIVSEIQQLILNQEAIIASIESGAVFATNFLSRLNIPFDMFQTKIEEKAMELASQAVNYTSLFILGSIQSLSHQSIGLLIMYFLLYYLFTEEDSDFMRQVTVAVPFNEENTATLLNEFRRIVRTTLTASGAVALAQGGVLTIAFLFFNIQGAFLWGAIAAVLSFLPLVGAAFVWIPAVIVQFFQADYAAAIGILAAGLFISVLDNFLRPMVQKTVGKIHPLLSLLGIVIGVSLFGLIGIVIGPLLLSYFILTVQMFSREYLS